MTARPRPVKEQQTDKPILTEFIIGETDFQSRGFSSIKVTKEGSSSHFTLPIRSIGIMELQEELKKSAPKPPVKLKTVYAGSEDAERLGLKETQTVSYFDATDPDYLSKFEEYNLNFLWRTVIAALDMEFKDSDGNPVTDFETIKKALVGSGMTGHHLDQIFSDVSLLTSDQEKKMDFLSGKRWG